MVVHRFVAVKSLGVVVRVVRRDADARAVAAFVNVLVQVLGIMGCICIRRLGKIFTTNVAETSIAPTQKQYTP